MLLLTFLLAGIRIYRDITVEGKLMEIKKYNEKYREDVQLVCKMTGPGECMTDEKIAAYIVNTYCNYYIDNEAENCFVLTDDDDIARGYIICCSDFGKFRKGFKKYLPVIKANAGKNIFEVYGEFLGTMLFSRSYPAHMHIDINYEFTGKGNGTKLLNELISHLKSKNVKGLMLIVGEGNQEAISFYKKNGFDTLLKAFGARIMGMKLS